MTASPTALTSELEHAHRQGVAAAGHGLQDAALGRLRLTGAGVAVLAEAADTAESAGRLVGWVNNAAVFRDVPIPATPAPEVLATIEGSLRPALAGCLVAVRRFLAAGTAGAIVNLSSHQAVRPVQG